MALSRLSKKIRGNIEMKKSKICELCFGVVFTVVVYIVSMHFFGGIPDHLPECSRASEIPEPVSMLLVTVGGLMIFKRNRKSRK